MFKITFLGAGSTVFAKNILGDCILTPELKDFEISLYDIDPVRLEDSRQMLENINKNYLGKAVIHSYQNRLEALRGANFIVNAVQVGGYKPSTVIDFEITKKYGLLQTIGDTMGISGMFRALRTFPVLDAFAEDIYKVCPNALLLNYSNPMSMLTGYMAKYLKLNVVGLCHSVQTCANTLLKNLGMGDKIDGYSWKIAGINHQAWLLEIKDKFGVDLYPEIKENAKTATTDLVRLEILKRFGYYNTESSEHTAEYSSYFIKKNYPEFIQKYNIPLDDYPRRCEEQIEAWKNMRKDFVSKNLEHKRTHEFGSYIIQAKVTDVPYKIHGNVMNNGLITNLPQNACVEVPCMVDRNGINPCVVGALPEQLASLNRNNINVQLMAIEAGITKKKEAIYQAAYLDQHAAAELSLDEIKAMCDDLIEAHKDYLPQYK